MKAALQIFCLCVLCLGFRAFAQTSTQDKGQAFPDARFYGEFRKHLNGDISEQFFAWQGRMGIDFAGYRKGKHSAEFKIDFQTVGAKMTNGKKVNLAGTSYIIEGRYGYALRKNLTFDGGVTHLSSHLAEDLLKLLKQANLRGTPVPVVNAEDLNVLFAEARYEAPRLPLDPQITLRAQPLAFHYRGGWHHYDQPVHLATEFTVWKRPLEKISFGSKHEWGHESWNDVSANLDLFRHDQSEGRVRLFVGWSPGAAIRVAPTEGWHYAGLYTGVRVIFHTH